jgi:hypothetical protein
MQERTESLQQQFQALETALASQMQSSGMSPDEWCREKEAKADAMLQSRAEQCAQELGVSADEVLEHAMRAANAELGAAPAQNMVQDLHQALETQGVAVPLDARIAGEAGGDEKTKGMSEGQRIQEEAAACGLAVAEYEKLLAGALDGAAEKADAMRVSAAEYRDLVATALAEASSRKH